ncbi:unnamed protein product [Plutella xylostella]|uniref:Galactose mutarotase n=1 Tax=Plutella xylostella TaxID=51655 RepID=A0A8S4GB19_PLUXY|nr:unnamed protein product [Plutella xylostella]
MALNPGKKGNPPKTVPASNAEINRTSSKAPRTSKRMSSINQVNNARASSTNNARLSTRINLDTGASGDVDNEEKVEEEEEKVPDVELIVDGFGFMPGHGKRRHSRMGEEASIESPCASSTNVDIVRRYTWRTRNRMLVQLISYGATFTTIRVPDKKGIPEDVIAGFDTLEEYFQRQNPYFGATIGRYANYICEGTMVVRPSGRLYMLSQNKHHHHYNGGYIGFDKVNWRSYVSGNKVIMSHVSERFSEGYPGTVLVQSCFEVTCDNTIKIEMKCTTSEPTIINLSICPYFNLAGHQAGNEEMLDHIITINGDKFTPTADDGLPTGEKKVVGGTAYDFRVPRMLKVMMPKIPMGGYNLNYCITKGVEQELTFHARAVHARTGRVVEVYSNQPGMQFYTGNNLPDPDKIVELLPGEEDEMGEAWEVKEEEMVEGAEASEAAEPVMTRAPSQAAEAAKATAAESKSSTSEEESELLSERSVAGESSEGSRGVGYVPLYGKGNALYIRHGFFCFMPQNYPDAVNHKNFPNSVLNPGEVYVHKIEYKFGLLLGKFV